MVIERVSFRGSDGSPIENDFQQTSHGCGRIDMSDELVQQDIQRSIRQIPGEDAGPDVLDSQRGIASKKSSKPIHE